MKVFVFDYGSSAGLAPRELAPSLRLQGALMYRALMADLRLVPGLTLIAPRDFPLTAPGLLQSASLVDPGADGHDNAHYDAHDHTHNDARHEAHDDTYFDACVRAADAVWLVAPELGGILERLSRQVLRRKRILLGSKPGAVRVASSKLRTVRALARAGVKVVDTYTAGQRLPGTVKAWVVKPDNGAACLNTRLFSGAGDALAWIGAHEQERERERYVLQPYIAGQACSLSLLCCDGAARVLSCNEQRIAVRDNQFHFLGSTVNRMTDASGQLARLARKIAAAIPGLWGYVGVDFILADENVIVLEVNPRMTTSCAGLNASIGCNPAALVLGLLRGPAGLIQPAGKSIAVSVDVADFDSF